MGMNYYTLKKNIPQELKSKSITTIKDLFELQSLIDDYISESKIHIGKASKGWKFTFDTNGWKYYYTTLDSILSFLQTCYCIFDEDLNILSIEDFKKIVESHYNDCNYEQYLDMLLKKAINKQNGKIEDPLNLIPSYEQAMQYKQEYLINPYKYEFISKGFYPEKYRFVPIGLIWD